MLVGDGIDLGTGLVIAVAAVAVWVVAIVAIALGTIVGTGVALIVATFVGCAVGSVTLGLGVAEDGVPTEGTVVLVSAIVGMGGMLDGTGVSLTGGNDRPGRVGVGVGDVDWLVGTEAVAVLIWVVGIEVVAALWVVGIEVVAVRV